MNPAFLDNMSWEIAEVYGAITDQILINLSRYFRYYSPGDKIPRTAFEYQAQMLAQMGKVNRDTIRIIRNGLEGADDALKSTLEQAIIDSVSKSQPELLKGVKAGVLAPQGVPIVAPNQMRAFELYYKQSADRLNLVNTVMLESTKSAYQQTITDVINDIALSDRVAATYEALDVAAGETITGVSSWNTALRHATDKLKNRGITGFIDHAGRQWSAEAYVAMDVRTTTFNVGRSAVWEQNQDFGNDLYLVSYHNGARPGCYDWQNKVISSLNSSRDVVDIDGNTIHVYAQNDTTYGQPAGLFGINCKHYPTPFIPGVSVINGQPQSPEENKKTYEESQEQRRLERKLREEKRDYLMAKEQGASPEELAKLKDKTRRTSQDIDDFCEQTGRARHRDREAVYTKREFPDKKKYDVTAFEHEQQNAINEYFKDGGAQREFTAGEIVQNAPTVADVPKVPAEAIANADVSTFNPATTVKEAETYAKEHFAKLVDYNGLSVDQCNAFNATMQELTDKYPTDKIMINKRAYRGGSTAWADGSEILHTGKNLDKNMGVSASWASAKAEYAASAEMYKTAYEGRKMPASVARTVREFERYTKFDRWCYGDNTVRDVITHEYGHVLADQRIGQINGKRYCKNYGHEALKLKTLITETRKEVRKTGEIFSMSAYADKDDYEFFAESFAGYNLGYELPKSVVVMLERVLAFGKV